MIEYQLFPPIKSANAATADDDHGEKNEGFVDVSGAIGCMISIAKAAATGGGADITISVYGSVILSVFNGIVNARGTISGMISLYNLKFSPSFGWSKAALTVEIRVSVRIAVCEFHISVTLSTDGGWKVSISKEAFSALEIVTKVIGFVDVTGVTRILVVATVL